MTFIRPKPKPPKLGLREPAVLRSDKHLRFVRRHGCVVVTCESREIEAAHLRSGLPAGEMGGIGIKPSDVWVTPQCRTHHHESHQHGEKSFATKYGLNLVKLALAYASKSPDPSVRERAEQLRSLV